MKISAKPSELMLEVLGAMRRGELLTYRFEYGAWLGEGEDPRQICVRTLWGLASRKLITIASRTREQVGFEITARGRELAPREEVKP